MADGRIPEMERGIKALCLTEIVMIGPEKYNELYARIGNLNRLLAWAHGKVIEGLLERATETPVDWVLIDRFAGEHVIRRALGPRGKSVRLDQWPRADRTRLLVRRVYSRAAPTCPAWSPCPSDLVSNFEEAGPDARFGSRVCRTAWSRCIDR